MEAKKVRWHELPQHRRDEIETACVLTCGLTRSQLVAAFPSHTDITLYDVEGWREREARETAERNKARTARMHDLLLLACLAAVAWWLFN